MITETGLTLELRRLLADRDISSLDLSASLRDWADRALSREPRLTVLVQASAHALRYDKPGAFAAWHGRIMEYLAGEEA